MKQKVPAEILTQHVAVLGKTGSGKTSTAKLAIEQVVAEGARVCVLDPIKSDWWGLTSSANGKQAGLPFHILGGPHGHVPLHASAGKAIAEIVANGSLPLSIIDMAEFEPGGQAKFFVDFAPTLLRKMRGVVYLVIEEAHLFAPKERSGIGAENLSIHWAKTLATAGRSKGVRLVVLSQRVQALHNAVLGSCDTLIAHRLTAPADQEPIVKWLKANASKEILETVAGSLSSLKTGEGWICSGEAKLFERVSFGRISTYDNTATPTGDAEIKTVKTAAVDQDQLRALIGEAVEIARSEDPRELRKQIVTMGRELGQLKTDLELARRNPRGHEPAPPSKTVEKFVLKDGQLARAETILDRVEALIRKASDVAAEFGGTVLSQTLQDVGSEIANAIEKTRAPQLTFRPVSAYKQPEVIAAVRRSVVSAPPKPPRAAVGSSDGLAPAKQRILNALAFLHGIGVTAPDRNQVAFVAGTSPNGGSFKNNVSALRTSALLDYPKDGTLALTDAGAQVASTDGVPSTTAELHRDVMAKLPPAKQRILGALISAYPQALTRQELADAANTSADGGSFKNNVSAMRTAGLLDYPRDGEVAAQPVLFLEGR